MQNVTVNFFRLTPSEKAGLPGYKQALFEPCFHKIHPYCRNTKVSDRCPSQLVNLIRVQQQAEIFLYVKLSC